MASAKQIRVLLVDDDDRVRQTLRSILKPYSNIEVVGEARDGDEALALTHVPTTLIDLVVTDVVMPGLTGRELVSRLAVVFPNLRVLYTSGYTKSTTGAAGVAATAPFLPKPFLPTDLLTKVRDVLSGPAGVSA